MPEAHALARIRRNIDSHPQQIKSILAATGIRQEYLGGVSKDQAKVVKRFVDEHKETSLKTKPKVRSSFLPYKSYCDIRSIAVT